MNTAGEHDRERDAVGQWQRSARLTGSAPDDGFAYALALDGDRLAVSAVGVMSPNNAGNGVVKIYERQGNGDWTLQAQFFAGAPRAESAASDKRGTAYVFNKALNNGWVESTAFTAPQGTNDAKFGIGIPDEEIDKLFNTFTRASNMGQRPGTGLGLVVVRRCVHLHGGSLNLQSKCGLGTTARVTVAAFPSNQHPS